MIIMEVLKIVIAAVLAWFGRGWFEIARLRWEKRKVRIEHRHRVIEEHTKSLHKYVEQHYIPVCASSERLEMSLSQLRQRVTTRPSAYELRTSFFRLAQWSYTLYNWGKQIRGILMLRDRVAEILLERVLSKVINGFFALEPYLNVRDLHELSQIILESNEQLYWFLSEFQKKLDSDPRLARIYTRYQWWLAHVNILKLAEELRCYHKLFMYEINVCYEPWYGVELTKPRIDLTMVNGILEELSDEGRITPDDVKRYVKRYLKKLEPRRTPKTQRTPSLWQKFFIKR